MDITPFDIYLIMQADSAVTAAAIILVFSSIIGVSSAVVSAACQDDPIHTAIFRKMFKLAVVPWIISLVLAIALPSTKTLIAMYGIPATIEMAEGLELDETAKKAVKGINAILDNMAEQKDVSHN